MQIWNEARNLQPGTYVRWTVHGVTTYGKVVEGPVYFRAGYYAYTPEPRWMAKLWTPWPEDPGLSKGYVVDVDDGAPTLVAQKILTVVPSS